MKIKTLKREIKALKDFENKEWPIANLKDVGKRLSENDWKKEEYVLLALDDKDKIVGFLKFEIKAKVACAKRLLVSHLCRKQGIGKALMAKAEEMSKKVGCHKLYLLTGETWQAVKFYQVLGYKITGKLEKHYHGQNHLIFSKFFKP